MSCGLATYSNGRRMEQSPPQPLRCQEVQDALQRTYFLSLSEQKGGRCQCA